MISWTFLQYTKLESHVLLQVNEELYIIINTTSLLSYPGSPQVHLELTVNRMLTTMLHNL